MRIGLAAALVALAGAAAAEDVSVTCAVEWVRREAIVASDYTKDQPPWRYWVASGNQTLGPWTALEIKREMHLGRLPADVYVYPPDNSGWVATSQYNGFKPLPADPRIAPDQLPQALPGLVPGCWVSDPWTELAGDETVWLLMVMENGEFFQSRGVRTLASGKEGFWFSRGSTENWAVEAQHGAEFQFLLPDIAFFDPVDRFPARLVDRNTLVLFLPGSPGLTFRRM